MNTSSPKAIQFVHQLATGALFGLVLGLANQSGTVNPGSLLLPWAAFFMAHTLSEARGTTFSNKKSKIISLLATHALAVLLFTRGSVVFEFLGDSVRADQFALTATGLVLGIGWSWLQPNASLSGLPATPFRLTGFLAGAIYPDACLYGLAISAPLLWTYSTALNPSKKLSGEGALKAFVMTTGATWLASSIWIQSRTVLDPTAGGLLLATCAFYLFSLCPTPKLTHTGSALVGGGLLYAGVCSFVMLPQAHETLITPEAFSFGRSAAIWALLMGAPGLLLSASGRESAPQASALGVATGLYASLFCPWTVGPTAMGLTAIIGAGCVVLARRLLARAAGLVGFFAAAFAGIAGTPVSPLIADSSWNRSTLQMGFFSHLQNEKAVERRTRRIADSTLLQSASNRSGSFAVFRDRRGQVELDLDGLTRQFQGRSADTQRMLPHLASALHPAPLNALVLGDPLGLITSGLIQQEIDSIQVAVPMPEAIRALRQAEPAIEDSLLGASVRLIESAPNQLLRQNRPADLILEMAHSPWNDAFQGLPSSRQLHARAETLEEDGVYVLGVDLFWANESVLRDLLGSFHAVFPKSWAFLPPQGADQLVLVGFKSDRSLDWERFVRATQKGQATLSEIQIRSPLDLADRALCDEGGLQQMAPTQRRKKTIWLEGVHTQAGQLLPLFKPVLNGSYLFKDNATVVQALSDRQSNTQAFLSLLESNDRGQMEEVFKNSRALSRSKAGARALNPLIAPYLSRARAALQRGRQQGGMGTALQKAHTDLTAAILLNPSSVEAQALMGEVQFAQGQLAASSQSYRKALEMEPGLKEALLGLSQIALKRKDLPKAEELLRKATAANPRDWLCHYNLGAFLIDRGLLDEAEEVLRKSVALNEGTLSAPNTALAQLYLSRGEATAALMEGHRAIGIEKNAMNAYVLGKAYFEVEQNDTASQYFQRAILADPSFWQARAGMGLVFLEAGKWKQCKEAFQAVLNLDPSNPTAKDNLAICETQLGETPTP